MKESKRLQLKEFSEEIGVVIKDQDEFREHRSTYLTYKVGFFYFLGMLLLIALAVSAKEHIQFNHCLSYFSDETVQVAKSACKAILAR